MGKEKEKKKIRRSWSEMSPDELKKYGRRCILISLICFAIAFSLNMLRYKYCL